MREERASPSFTVRIGTTQDLPAVRHLADTSLSFAYPASDWHAWMQHPCFRLYLVQPVNDDFLVGFVLTQQSQTHDDVYCIAVDVNWRGRGLAKSMLALVHQAAAMQGKQWVSLHVDTTNIPALRCYTTVGYRFIRHIRDYYGQDQHGYEMHYKILDETN